MECHIPSEIIALRLMDMRSTFANSNSMKTLEIFDLCWIGWKIALFLCVIVIGLRLLSSDILSTATAIKTVIFLLIIAGICFWVGADIMEAA